MIKVKRNFREIIKRHKSFFNLEPVDRPLFCVYLIGRGYAAVFSNTFKNIPKGTEVRPEDINMEYFINDIEKIINMHEEAGQDIFYPIVPYSYIPWTEAIIGCPIYAGGDSFYAEPFIKNMNEIPEEIDLSMKNRWFKKLIDMKEVLVETFGENYPAGSSTHLRGPADMVAAAIGQNQFPLELYDNPKKIKKFIKICSEAFIEIAKTVNNIASKAKFKGYVVNNFGIYTEEVCQHYQDDAVAFLSPKFYKEFIVDDHLMIDKSFPSTLYHIHPVSLFIVDELVDFPNLRIIEVHREPLAVGPSFEEMLPAFKKIQDKNKALLINFTDIDFSPELLEKEVGLACKHLSPKGLCIYICAEDIEDGYKKTEAIKKVFKI